MTYGDLYDAIPLWWGVVGTVIVLVILVILVAWRRIHPR